MDDMTTPQPAPWQQTQTTAQPDPYLLALQGIRSTVDKIYTLMVVAVILGVLGGLLSIFRGIAG